MGAVPGPSSPYVFCPTPLWRARALRPGGPVGTVHSLAARVWERGLATPDGGAPGPCHGMSRGQVTAACSPDSAAGPSVPADLPLLAHAAAPGLVPPLGLHSFAPGLLVPLCPWECWGSGQPKGGVRLARPQEDPAGWGGSPSAGPCGAHLSHPSRERDALLGLGFHGDTGACERQVVRLSPCSLSDRCLRPKGPVQAHVHCLWAAATPRAGAGQTWEGLLDVHMEASWWRGPGDTSLPPSFS